MYKTNDQLWKGVIEEMFEDFVAFFMPALYTQIDFTKEISFLDKELEQIYSENDDKLRLVDKLVKVFMKNGEEHWILIHIEIQGYFDRNFPKRMYIYFVRLKEKYDKPISAIAIFSDDVKSYKPDTFEEKFYGTEIRYKYLTYKILDQKIAALQTSENPFATVIETALVALKKNKRDKNNDDDLLTLKIDLVKRLYEKKFSKSKIFALLNFIRYYVRFNKKETNLLFDEKVETFNHKIYPMGTQEILLHQAKTEGIEEGIDLGIEKGIDLGIEKGRANKELQFATSLIISTDFDDAKIALLVGVTEQYVIDLRIELESQ